MHLWSIGPDLKNDDGDNKIPQRLTAASAARSLKNLQNQAQALNMKLVPA